LSISAHRYIADDCCRRGGGWGGRAGRGASGFPSELLSYRSLSLPLFYLVSLYPPFSLPIINSNHNFIAGTDSSRIHRRGQNHARAAAGLERLCHRDHCRLHGRVHVPCRHDAGQRGLDPGPAELGQATRARPAGPACDPRGAAHDLGHAPGPGHGRDHCIGRAQVSKGKVRRSTSRYFVCLFFYAHQPI